MWVRDDAIAAECFHNADAARNPKTREILLSSPRSVLRLVIGTHEARQAIDSGVSERTFDDVGTHVRY